MIVALLNPAACRNRAHDVASALMSAAPRLRLVMSDHPDDVDALVRQPDTPELLVVVGGDGTLSHLLTRFHALDAWDRIPPLLVLPAGDMNTTARALVGVGDPAVLAERVLRSWGRGVRRLRQVPALMLHGTVERVGMTVSLGAVARTHEDYAGALKQGPLGAAEVLLRFGLQRLPSGRFRPLGPGFRVDGEQVAIPRVTAGVISPLPGFFGLVRPFPKVRTVSADGAYVALSGLGALATQASLPAIIRGHLPAGAQMYYGQHHTFDWVAGARTDLVAVDGEIIPVPAGAPVRVTQRGHVRLLVWKSMPASQDPVG